MTTNRMVVSSILTPSKLFFWRTLLLLRYEGLKSIYYKLPVKFLLLNIYIHLLVDYYFYTFETTLYSNFNGSNEVESF